MSLGKNQARLSGGTKGSLYPIEMPRTARLFHDRLRDAREALRPKMTQKRAGDLIGVSEQAISQWERGLTEPTRENLLAAARVYGTRIEYLAYDDDDRLSVTSEDVAAQMSGLEAGMPYGGVAEAGPFRPVDMLDQESERRRIPFDRDPRYPRCAHAAYAFRGDSMDREQIFEGMWAIGVSYDDFLEHHGELRDGNIVVVERTRAQGSERELTIKQVRFFRDRMELWPKSSNSNHAPIIVPYDQSESDGTVRIVALVVKAVRLFL